uniref:Uncharacterized protein n=1 Tax=Aegilops tauschii subsp. strangulata TaxID=200361 RepID=A0A453QHK7_AEGTS
MPSFFYVYSVYRCLSRGCHVEPATMGCHYPINSEAKIQLCLIHDIVAMP